MRRSDFAFDLPAELIAQRPLPSRAASRLLVLDPAGAVPPLRDLQIADLPSLLAPGDLLVFNDTRVVPARLPARKPTGGRVELLLERAIGGDEALVQIRGGKGLRDGAALETAGGPVVILGRDADLWRVRMPAPPLEFLERHGEVPLPPYIERAADAADRERYQSLLARVPGSVAAPTASLHFDAALLAQLDALGVRRATVTLHVGAGTFQPVRTLDPAQHRMHAESTEVPAATCEAVAAARAAGRRVIAVGTTVVRTLESAADPDGRLRPGRRETDIFILPGYRWRVVDALLTNFHLSESTLLMLVCAFAGRDATLAAYRHAVASRYRFFSYGDAMFLARAAQGSAPAGAEPAP
ncbi:MAG: tRNA preQ1(34) S-adenosylmethionine ribosyltransferase-isomerase QueA [Steroidobacteraceae bacterium]